MPKNEQCKHYSFDRCKKQGTPPNLAKEMLLVPLGELEGPGLSTERTLGCTVAGNQEAQKGCDGYENGGPRAAEADTL